MHIPDDPLTDEIVLLHAGRYRLPLVEHNPRQNWRADLLGPMVSEGARLTALQGAEILFIPPPSAWHPKEKAEYGVAPAEAGN